MPSPTTTTLPTADSICVDGLPLTNVRVRIRNLGGGSGDEAFNISGMVVTAGGTPIDLDPARRGMQLLLEDLGATPPVLIDLTAARQPIPAGVRGTGCDPNDGWNGLTYRNRFGTMPPTCSAGSAQGLQKVRLRDRRARGGGILFQISGRHATLPIPVGPLRVTIVFGADRESGEGGECGSLALLEAACRPKRTSVRCK